MSSSLVTLSIIAAWYASNIGVLLLNKYLLSIFKFRFPVFITLCHMVACTTMSYFLAVTGTVPRQSLRSRAQLYKVSVLAVVFCFTVALGNVSLRYIPVSFNQAIGATTPAFTALLNVIMAHQQETRGVYLTLVPVVVGIIIASGAEPSFHLFGFITAVSATALRAFKSVLQGMLLSDPSEKLDSMNLLLYMAPVAVLVLIPMTLIYESQALAEALEMGAGSTAFFVLLGLNSAMAYFTNLFNFLVTKHTSALTLQVIGNAKGVVAVVISVLYFGNPVTIYSALGYAITVTGVVLYSQAKKRAKRVAQLEDKFKTAESREISILCLEQGQANGGATMLHPKQRGGLPLASLLRGGAAAVYNIFARAGRS